MRLLLIMCVAGCAANVAEAPLTVKLGLGHQQTESALHEHQYCHKGDVPEKLETYPRCDRPGTEWGESWVTARFDGDKLVELRRWERFTDSGRAVERWNQLVADRGKLTQETPDAIEALRAKGLLEPGTKTVKAFRVDPETVVGVYLLTPTPPEEANILEAIIHIAK